MSTEKEIVLAISGGIAAYKSVTIASRFFKAGHKIHVLMTPAASEFVKPLSFAAVTRSRVITEIMPEEDAEGQELFPHLYPASHADVFCVAPATADTMAKLVHGEADNIVSASALPLPPECRCYFCPAMNAGMWENPVVQENAKILRQRGWIQIGPDKGLLACGDTGYGRMSEPDAIADQVLHDLATPKSLEGKTLLITSGPTRERIDPVRYISNDSSGKMGKAIAEAASLRGANVEFVSGPVPAESLPRGPRISIHHVESACEMLACVQPLFGDANATVFAAAVADFRPAETADAKMEKDQVADELKLARNPDIAATISKTKSSDQICVGFALQTHDGIAKAKSKREAKNLDAIVLNGPDSLGSVFGNFTLITPEGDSNWGETSKLDCAKRLVDWISIELGR